MIDKDYKLLYERKCDELEVLYAENCEYKHQNEKLLIEVAKLKSAVAELERYVFLQNAGLLNED